MQRLVAWIIRAGGGVRTSLIAKTLAEWRADLLILNQHTGRKPDYPEGMLEVMRRWRKPAIIAGIPTQDAKAKTKKQLFLTAPQQNGLIAL